MIDGTLSVEEVSRKKKRLKAYQLAMAYMEMPMQFLAPNGLENVKGKILSIILESGNRITQSTFENMQRNREEKREWKIDDQIREDKVESAKNILCKIKI